MNASRHTELFRFQFFEPALVPGRRTLTFVAVAALCLASPALRTAGATTAPDQLFTIRAVMKPTGITLVRTAVTKPYVGVRGVDATFVRGSIIRFSVMDKGTTSYVAALHALDPQNAALSDHVLKYTKASPASPGKTVDLVINFYYRGRFLLLTLEHGHPIGKPVAITIK